MSIRAVWCERASCMAPVGADVLIASGSAVGTDRWAELPPAVADDLAALPGLVDRALG